MATATGTSLQAMRLEGIEAWPLEQRDGLLRSLGPVARSRGLRLLRGPDARAQPRPAAPATAVVVEGPLGPAHVGLLSDEDSALLLAAREDGAPSIWEANLLFRLLEGLSLNPLPPARLEAVRLGGIADLHALADRAAALARQSGGGSPAATLVADVAYELGANALLDAPRDAHGGPKYAHRRDSLDRVDPADVAGVQLGVEPGRIFLEAVDRFGALGIGPFRRILQALGSKASVDSGGGGAGLGLRRMIEHSDACVVRVTPGRETRVLCAVNLGPARRRALDPKSLLFRVERG